MSYTNQIHIFRLFLQYISCFAKSVKVFWAPSYCKVYEVKNLTLEEITSAIKGRILSLNCKKG